MAVEAYIEIITTGFIEQLTATSPDVVEIITAGPQGPPGSPSTDVGNSATVGTDGKIFVPAGAVLISTDDGNIITTGEDGGIFAEGGGGSGNATPSTDEGNIITVGGDGGLFAPAPPTAQVIQFNGTPQTGGTVNVTRAAIGAAAAATTLDAIPAAAASVDLNEHKLVNLGDPTLDQDATTMAWVLAQIAALQSNPFRLVNSATDPDGSFLGGELYWNNSIHKIKVYNDDTSAWEVADGITVSGTEPDTTDWDTDQLWLDTSTES